VLGGCLIALHRYDEAEPLLLESHAVLRARKGERSREARDALEWIAQLYEAWGKPDKARDYRAAVRSVSNQARATDASR
jgi:hypothetical protein